MHYFLYTLDCEGKLLQVYSQNLDSLEHYANLHYSAYDNPFELTIQLHGHLDALKCNHCHHLIPFSTKYIKEFKKGMALLCTHCPKSVESNTNQRCSKWLSEVQGVLLPDILLYNQPHPRDDFMAEVRKYDCSQHPDVLMVMGTHLTVEGVADLVECIAQKVHQRKNGVVIYIDINDLPQKTKWKKVFDYYL